MKIKQIYQLINSINKQMWGENAISVNDLRDVISLGETLQLNEDDADADDDIIISAIVKVFSDNISHAEHILSTLNSKVYNKIS